MRVGIGGFVLILASAAAAGDYDNISAGETRWLQQIEADITIVDVREQSEWDGGHIEGAILMPWNSGYLQAHHTELPTNMLIVHCASGGRSAAACNWLTDNGHTNVHNMLYGYGKWVYLGLEGADVIYLPTAGWDLIGMGAAETVVWENCHVCTASSIRTIADAETWEWLQSAVFGYEDVYFTVGIGGGGDTDSFESRQGYWLLTYLSDLTIILP